MTGVHIKEDIKTQSPREGRPGLGERTFKDTNLVLTLLASKSVRISVV